MNKSYLIMAVMSFIATWILNNGGYQAKWITLGFAIIMLLFGIFNTKYVEPMEIFDEEPLTNNLNEKELVTKE